MLAAITRGLMRVAQRLRWSGVPPSHDAPNRTAADWQADGDIARDQRNWGAAKAAYFEYVALVPDDFAIWVQLGHALKEDGDLDGASTAYLRALDLRETDHDLLVNIGHLHKLQGRNPSAIEFFARSLLIKPDREVERVIRDLRDRQAGRFPAATDPTRSEDIRRLIAGSTLFDPVWYWQAYHDVRIFDGSALDHYLSVGTYERRSPGPDFDPVWYIKTYNDTARDGESIHFDPLLHFLELGEAQGRAIRRPVFALLTAQDVLSSVRDLDPALFVNTALGDLSLLPMIDLVPRSRAYKNFVRIFRSLPDQPQLMICVGVTTDMSVLNDTLAPLDTADILVLACDDGEAASEMTTCGGARQCNLANAEEDYTPEERAQTLIYLVQAIRPKKILNIDSEACWEMYARRGAAVSAVTSSFAFVQSETGLAGGRLIGYAASHFRESIAELSGVYCDNAVFYDKIVNELGLIKSMSAKFFSKNAILTDVIIDCLVELSQGEV